MIPIIPANWPAPAHITAFTTTRLGGCSLAPYDQLNLGDHVNDDIAHVLQNRALLREQLPAEPCWLQQIHSNHAVDASSVTAHTKADACYTDRPNTVCAVLTADCLPVLLCDRQGTKVAAIHAGWRGLANGVIAQTIQQMSMITADLLAWLGPAIGPQKFEVGDEVRDDFMQQNPQHASAFIASHENKWLANLYQLATQQLNALGVQAIYGGDHCTFTERELFYSFRRDGITGRMANVIWINNPAGAK